MKTEQLRSILENARRQIRQVRVRFDRVYPDAADQLLQFCERGDIRIMPLESVVHLWEARSGGSWSVMEVHRTFTVEMTDFFDEVMFLEWFAHAIEHAEVVPHPHNPP